MASQKRKISFIVTDSGIINAVVKGRAFSVPPDHTNYERIKTALINDDEDDFITQTDVAKAVEQFTAAATADNVGEVTIKDGQVYWKGEVVHNVVADRILMLMRSGFPFDPMLKFLENLMKNPSYRAVTELYTFLDRQGLPITEDGHFLGYKRVNEDYNDCHTGTISNKIGCIPTMPRNTVDDNWRQLCSSGFHVGSIEYVRDFCNDPVNHVMIVKVNPADVVAVPSAENTKLRTCKYEVVSEYDKKLLQPLQSILHTATGVPVQSNQVKDGVTSSWDELDTEDEEDSDLESDIDWDDDDDDDDGSELEYTEEQAKRLVEVAVDKKADPYKLAYRLDINLGAEPTVDSIIREALCAGYSIGCIEETIAKC